MNSIPDKPRWGDRDWHGEQNADGVDLTLIRRRLSLPPIERLREMERHADEVRMLMAYGRQHRANQARAHRGDPPQTRG